MKKTLISLVCAALVAGSGCESDDDYNGATNTVTDVDYDTGDKDKDKDETIIPDADKSDPFNITYPDSGGTVSKGTVTMKGVGISKDVQDYSVRVKTDGWYNQTGKLTTSENGSWSYSPLYLSGQGQYNNHTIEMKVNYTDGSSDKDTVTGIVRQ